ncbi:MAG: DUF4405 domain-containing protein [Candidatus Aminicenantes bacterium]|nr:DUF4405 domain-containing protein [Candidatus Aminicenantes bacterium]
MDKSKWKYLIDVLLFICLVGLAGIGYLQGLVLEEGPVEDVSKKYFMGLHTHQWGHIHFYISIAFTVLIIIHLILSWNWIKSCTKKIFKKGWKSALIGILAVSLCVPLIIWAFSPKYSEKYAEFGTKSGRGRQISAPAEQIKEPVPTNKETSEIPRTQKKQQPKQKQDSIDSQETVLKQEELHEDEREFTRGRLDTKDTGIMITGQMTLWDLEEKTGIPKSTLLKELGIPNSVPSNESLGRLKRRYNFTMQELRDKIEALLKKK